MTTLKKEGWQEHLRAEENELEREFKTLERRYNAQDITMNESNDSSGRVIRCWLSLSDPDLPIALRERVELAITLPSDYPVAEPTVAISKDWTQKLLPAQVTAIDNAILATAKNMQGTYCLRKLLTWIDNHVYPLLQSASSEDDPNDPLYTPPAEEPVEEDTTPQITKSLRPCRFFAKGFCRNGDTCRYSHDIALLQTQSPEVTDDTNAKPKKSKGRGKQQPKEDAEAREPSRTTSDNDTKNTAKKSSRKRRPRKCRFFARGECRNGDECKYRHVQDTGEEKEAEEANEKGVKVVPTSGWTEAQQLALDNALRKYPSTKEGMTAKERWMYIANEVDGKSLNECIDRFQYLRTLVLSEMKQEVTHETDEEEESDNDSPLDPRIIASSNRVDIETEPRKRGTAVSLPDLFLYETGTLIVQRLRCNMQCLGCPFTFDVTLSLDDPEYRAWCPRCSLQHAISFHPVFAHNSDPTLCLFDTDNCSALDVLPSDLVAVCLQCDTEVLFQDTVPARRSESSCLRCHTKLAVNFKRFAIHQLTPPSASSLPFNATTKKTRVPTGPVLQLGEPLPDKGTCEHYRHSQRWFRFQCCGKLFPCDVCHDKSDCEAASAGVIASRMVCGLCSKEQSSQVKVCSCGNQVGREKQQTRFWEGGKGCRDQSRMDPKDPHKYRGKHKTMNQKAKRVGEEAKRRRQRGEKKEATA